MRKPIVAAPAAPLAGLSRAAAQENEPQFTSPHITVSSTTTVEVRPDIATPSLGVVGEKPTEPRSRERGWGEGPSQG